MKILALLKPTEFLLLTFNGMSILGLVWIWLDIGFKKIRLFAWESSGNIQNE